MTSSFNISTQGGQYFRYCGYLGWFMFAGALVDWILLQARKEQTISEMPAAKEG
jgi:hypothetical protein